MHLRCFEFGKQLGKRRRQKKTTMIIIINVKWTKKECLKKKEYDLEVDDLRLSDGMWNAHKKPKKQTPPSLRGLYTIKDECIQRHKWKKKKPSRTHVGTCVSNLYDAIQMRATFEFMTNSN